MSNPMINKTMSPWHLYKQDFMSEIEGLTFDDREKEFRLIAQCS
jgi:hypothetical protein